MKTYKMTEIALMTALIAIVSPFTINLAGSIPLSLATFVIMLAGSLLGAKEGLLCTALYLLLGAIGIPVFSGFGAGIGKLVGVTGGFLIGYLPLAYFSGLFIEKNRPVWNVLGMILGNVVLYILGVIWFLIVTKSTLMAALVSCVFPFLLADAIKIAVVVVLQSRLIKVIKHIRKD